MRLHKRYMFVRGGMVNNLRTITIENLFHYLLIENISYRRHEPYTRMDSAQLLVYKIEAAFRPLEQDEHFRLEGSQLSTKFGPDATPFAFKSARKRSRSLVLIT